MTAAPDPQTQPALDRDAAKRERFVRLATQRTRKAIAALELLGNCADKQSYTYSEEEATAVRHAINSASDALCEKFLGETKRHKLFNLPEPKEGTF